MSRIYHAWVAVLHILLGKDYFFAMVKSVKPAGIDYHVLEHIPDSKVVRETFLVSIAGDVAIELAASEREVDGDIERMLDNVERPA